MFFHGQTLYEELLRVPLLVRVPGVAPRQVDSVVELIDVAPTLVDLIGAPAPRTWVGRSLVPALAGDTLPPRAAHAELLPAPSWNHDAKALISGDGRWKLFYRISDSRFELYDLSKDADEQKDLWSSAPEDGKKLQAEMLEWIEVGLGK
jgi:choline-sulfatase